MDNKDRKKYAILDILSNSSEPLSSIAIANELNAQGSIVSERTVRLYLKEFDQLGFTENVYRKGRKITELGRQEIQNSRALERVGYLSGKIDAMAYRMTFNPDTCTGTVIMNISIIPIHEFTVYRRKMFAAVFAKKYAMGKMIALYPPGSLCMDTVIPEKHVGLGTICSITFNGVLRQMGIPVYSRFGGLMEIRNHKPIRFVELTNYDATSIDPLAVFIRAGMANYIGALNNGAGLIGASMREFPAESIGIVRDTAQKLVKLGIANIICIGSPGHAVFDFQLSPLRAGAIINGGLNPVSVFVETGVNVKTTTLAGIVPYEALIPYTQLDHHLDQLSK